MNGWMNELRALKWDFDLARRHWEINGGLEHWVGERLRRVSPQAHESLRRIRRKLDAPPRQPDSPQSLPAWGSTVTVDGITMRIDERMSAHNVRKLVTGRHGRHERELLARVLEAEDVVLELGGGIGMVAIACAKVVGSERVFSYEANPELESLIRDNYALNGVAPTLAMCMLGKEEGLRPFHLAERFERSSTFDCGQGMRTIAVPVRAFSKEVARIRPTVLIVDIQGGEAELLEYADLSTVVKLLVEVHPDIVGVRRANAVRRRLRDVGFTEAARAGQDFLYIRSQAR